MSTTLLLLALLGGPSAPEGPSPTVPSGDTTRATGGAPAADQDPSPDPAPTRPERPVLPEAPVLPEPPPGDGPRPDPGPDPGPELVRWSAPAGCPTAAALRQGIELRLGRRLSAGEVRVDATVVDHAGGYRLTLRAAAGDLVDGRTLDANDCQALADATALIVALAVDPVAVAGAIELWGAAEPEIGVAPVEPLPATPEPAPPAEASSPPPARAPKEPARGLRGGVLRLDGGVGLGAVPGVTGAFSLAGGLRWARARLELAGSYWIPRRSEPVDGARVQVQLGAAELRGCGVLARDRLEAPLCGGLAVGGMRGAGEGALNAQDAQGLWLALEAGVGLSWWFSPRWGLAGGFSAAVPLVQPGFDLARDPPVRLFEPAAVAGRLWLGIELRLNSP